MQCHVSQMLDPFFLITWGSRANTWQTQQTCNVLDLDINFLWSLTKPHTKKWNTKLLLLQPLWHLFFISPNGHSIFLSATFNKNESQHLNEFLLVWNWFKTTPVGLDQFSYGGSLVLCNHSLLCSGDLDILRMTQSLFVGTRTRWSSLLCLLSRVGIFWKGYCLRWLCCMLAVNEKCLSDELWLARPFLWNCGESWTVLSDLDLQMHCVSKQRRWWLYALISLNRIEAPQYLNLSIIAVQVYNCLCAMISFALARS